MALLTIQHFTHQQHPIILHDDTINPKYLCEGCMTYGYGTRYHCHACTFNLHEYCAMCPRSLSSFMHPDHSLMLVERDHDLGERIYVCNVCRDPIEGLSYRCEDCGFDVHPICTQLPETLNHILHQAHPLKLLLGSAEPVGTCAVCRGACNPSSWRYRCALCEFDIHIDCVPLQCEERTTTDRGIPTYVPPSLLFPQQPYLGGYAYGSPYSHPLNMNHNHKPQPQPNPQPQHQNHEIPYSHPLNMNHNYMPQPQPQQPPQPQHQNHEIPYWHPSSSTRFPSPLNMNHNNVPQPKSQPQPQHQNHEIPYWHPSTCFPSPLNMSHTNVPQPQLQPQHQNPEIPYWHPSPSSCFLSPLNMNHNNVPQPQLQPQHQNHEIPYWHPSTSPCFPSPFNMNYNNIPQPKPQLHYQNHEIPYWHPSTNPFPSPSNMHHYNYNMPQYPQLYQQHQGHGQAQTHTGGSGIGRVMFNLVKTIGSGVISHVIFGVDVSPFFAF